jgi:dihydrofolate reductase
MRTVTYGAACSLDGFITGPNESLDWLHWSKDASDIMTAYWKPVDTILMGRKTWDISLKLGDPPIDMGAMHTYVFSRTLDRIDHKGVTLVKEDPAEFVRALKAKPGGDICLMGGSDFARSLMAAGVVDELGVNVHPVLLGSGVPFFVDAGRRISLALKESRTIDGGCVYSTYRVTSGTV